MGLRVETEKKYYCADSDILTKKVLGLGLKLESNNIESDEYFTDINSIFIKNRTCLRIRKTNNKEMEVTFKGKSIDLTSSYCKIENNLAVNINEYDNYLKFLISLGYYSYVIVNKKRETYSVKKDDLIYSVMIDQINDIGGFAEFEILADSNSFDLGSLKNKLNDFVMCFSELKLEEATLPYRDIVANYLYKEVLPKKDRKGLLLNLDFLFLEYEKEFFKQYKQILSAKKINITWGTYKKNNNLLEKNDSSVKDCIDNYFEQLSLKDSRVVLLLKLLNKIKEKNFELILTTKCNELFINNLFNRIDAKSVINKENIYYLKTSSLSKELKDYNIDPNNYFNLENKSLEEINSILLIILNN